MPSEFESALLERLSASELGGTSSRKWDDLAGWLADRLDVPEQSVVCKYVHDGKNRWNRLNEALRRRPRVVLFLNEGPDLGALQPRLEAASVSAPELELLIAMSRTGADAEWRMDQVLLRSMEALPAALRLQNDNRIAQFTSGRVPDLGIVELPPFDPEAAVRLVNALLALAEDEGDAASPHRRAVSAALFELTGISPGGIAFKAVPSIKNLANRLGEGLGRGARLAVLVVPEALVAKTLTEVMRWSGHEYVGLLLQGGSNVRLGVTPGVGLPTLRGRIDQALRVGSAQLDAEPPLVWGATKTPTPKRQLAIPWSANWRNWFYSDWNDRLIDYCFSSDSADAAVERLPATPEELCRAVGAPTLEASTVVAAFLASVRKEVGGRSLCGFSHDYVGRRASNPWSVRDEANPHFFGVLWLTCFVAYGFPDVEGGFVARLEGAVGKRDHQCLPDLWRDMATWTDARRAEGDAIRQLVLPPFDGRRPIIGHSHFLAFPHRGDRAQLSRLLADADLLGEPPIGPVVRVLDKHRGRFTSVFVDDLDGFVRDYLDAGRDPRGSAFWRAVRQECLNPLGVGDRRSDVPVVVPATIMATWDEEETLLPYVAVASDWRPPADLALAPLEFEAGQFEHRVSFADPEREDVDLARVALSEGKFLSPSARRSALAGVLPLIEVASGEYRLAEPGEVAGCEMAMTRADRTASFVLAFGGRHEESALSGWHAVVGCRVRELDEPAPGLAGVPILLHTTQLPQPRLVGGLRTLTGAYYRLPGYLPVVRAPGAKAVSVLRTGAGAVACSGIDASDWALPFGALNAASFKVRATYAMRIDGHDLERTAEVEARVRNWTAGIDYRGCPSGAYWVESCNRGLDPLEGPSEDLPLLISAQEQQPPDLIGFDASARWLGPGVGEIALRSDAGFPWIAVGPLKKPEWVVLRDIACAEMPDNGWCADAADRRNWRRPFDSRVPAVRRDGDRYVRIAEGDPGLPLLRAYRARSVEKAPPADGERRTCAAVRLEDVTPDREWGVEPADAVASAADVLSVLALSRSGIPLGEVNDHLGDLLGVKDEHELREQIILGWAAQGQFDIVRRQDGRQRLVVCRRPRFVMYRRGPALVGSVIGLLPSSFPAVLERETRLAGGRVTWVRPVNPLQPMIPRVHADRPEVFARLARELEFAPSESLLVDPDGTVAAALRVHGDVERTSPPDMYTKESVWDWTLGAFRRNAPPGEVSVERRRHGFRAPIYVVTAGGKDVSWSYSKPWAIIAAAERAGRSPFARTPHGVVQASGHSPCHLPTPLGRLCAVLGMGVPGPVIADRRVSSFCYPFGVQLQRLVLQVIPPHWLAEV